MSTNNSGHPGTTTQHGSAVDSGVAHSGKSKLNNNLVQPVPISTFGDIPRSKAVVAQTGSSNGSLMRMMDVPVSLVFEVGRTVITISDLMELRHGSFIDLRNLSVDVIDVRANDMLIAEAEAISLQQRYGMRISDITKIPGTGDDEHES